MKGTVTIHADGKKIYEDTNVLTDAGGEILAEAMTVSPSLSGIASASSILDASNYTIQAISFGKSADSYAASDTNAHMFHATTNHYAFIRVGAGLSGRAIFPHVIMAAHRFSNPGGEAATSPLGASGSFHPTSLLPNEPTPMDTRLESGSTAVSGRDPYWVNPPDATSDLSALIHNSGDIGQNINLGPSAYTYAQISVHDALWDSRGVAASSQMLNLIRSHYGCYADSSGSISVMDPNDPAKRAGSFAYLVSSFDDIGSGELDADEAAASSVYAGLFNSASSMDTSGYVTMISTGINDEDASYTSGLTIQAGDTTFSSTGKVTYQVMIGSGDVGAANMYGGIYNMGLWGLDVPATIQDGGVAPFAWGPVTSKRKYKLFSKKGFNKNICHSTDWGAAGNKGMENPKDLLISWTIDFFGPTE